MAYLCNFCNRYVRALHYSSLTRNHMCASCEAEVMADLEARQ